jgi:hypothetical protein
MKQKETVDAENNIVLLDFLIIIRQLGLPTRSTSTKKPYCFNMFQCSATLWQRNGRVLFPG